MGGVPCAQKWEARVKGTRPSVHPYHPSMIARCGTCCGVSTARLGSHKKAARPRVPGIEPAECSNCSATGLGLGSVRHCCPEVASADGVGNRCCEGAELSPLP
jgi:hypothetical protein